MRFQYSISGLLPLRDKFSERRRGFTYDFAPSCNSSTFLTSNVVEGGDVAESCESRKGWKVKNFFNLLFCGVDDPLGTKIMEFSPCFVKISFKIY